MLLALLLNQTPVPLAPMDVSMFKRCLGEHGPHLAVDDDPNTVWKGHARDRASFWFHQSVLVRLHVTGCSSGTVRVRTMRVKGGLTDPPWTDVVLDSGVVTDVPVREPAFELLQLELGTATCIAALELEGLPAAAKTQAVSFSSPSRLGVVWNDGGTCRWDESEPELHFRGTCAFTETEWSLRGTVQRPNGRCWMPGMPPDMSGPECEQVPLAARWPVTRVNRCLVFVDGRSFGRDGCW